MPAVRGRRPDRRRRRDARHGRRVRLRQVDAGGDGAAAAARRRRRSTGEVLLDGEDVLTHAFGRAAGGALGRGVDRVPGRAALAQPGAAASATRSPSRSCCTTEVDRAGAPSAASASCSSRSACRARRARRYPHQLSGGQKQRVMIAMALACRPAAGHRRRADHRARRDGAGAGARRCSTALVRELGVGMVMISHDLSVLGSTCDRVAVMYAGRIVEEGPAARGLRPSPLHPYARALAAAFPTHRRPGVPLRARAACPATRRDPATCRAAARSTRAARCAVDVLPTTPSRRCGRAGGRRPRRLPASRRSAEP